MGPRTRRGLATAVAMAAALVVCPARADDGDGSLRVDVAAPADCPSRDALLAAVQARGGRTHAVSGDVRAPSYRITLSSGAPATGHLDAIEPDGTTWSRDLRGATCSEVADALALVLALDLDAAPAAPAPSPLAPPPPLALDLAPPAAPHELPPASRSPSSHWVLSGSLGVVATGILAGPEAFFEAAALPSGSRRGVYLVLDGRLGASQAWSYPAATAGGGHFSRTTALVDACPLRLAFDPVSASLCARAEAGVLDASGSTETLRPWLAPGAMAVARWAVADRVFLQLEGGAVVPLVRDRFFFEDPTSLAYAVPPVDARGSVAAGVRFW